MTNHSFSKDVLNIDLEEAVEKICAKIRETVFKRFKKKGVVVGLSGGIDSSVTIALSIKAVGAEKVIALLMPEKHSAGESTELGELVAKRFSVETKYENISGILEAAGFYEKYISAVQRVIAEYNENWKSKITIPSVLESNKYSIFSVVAQNPAGETIKKRLTAAAYLEILAATNFKQRTRKMMEYYHADRLNYAVAGTPNRLEYDQGFFVKLGDGSADLKPIAHLYKSQVYQIAEYLEVPEEVRIRKPTTDTYSLPQGQDEFYFSLPYDQMDLCLYAFNHDIPASQVAEVLGFTDVQIERVFKDIVQKRHVTKYLHCPPVLMEEVPEIAY